MPKSIYDRGLLKPDDIAEEDMLMETVGFRRLEPKSA